MLSRLITGLACLALVLIGIPAVAQLPLPDAGADAATVLHLSARAEKSVPRDRLRAELRAEGTGADAGRLQGEINRRLTVAVAQAKAVPGTTLETTGYTVFQERPDKAPPRWHGSAGLMLTSKDFGGLLDLVGALQQTGLELSHLGPELSREAQQAVEDELTAAALDRVRQRGARIAATLDTTIARYRSLQIGNAAVLPGPLRQMALMAGAASSAPPPVAQPGDAVVSVEVTAEILLAPPRR